MAPCLPALNSFTDHRFQQLYDVSSEVYYKQQHFRAFHEQATWYMRLAEDFLPEPECGDLQDTFARYARVRPAFRMQ
jgi:hypothetical protein